MNCKFVLSIKVQSFSVIRGFKALLMIWFLSLVLPLDHKGTILSKYGSIIYQAMRNIHHMIEEAIDLVKVITIAQWYLI